MSHQLLHHYGLLNHSKLKSLPSTKNLGNCSADLKPEGFNHTAPASGLSNCWQEPHPFTTTFTLCQLKPSHKPCRRTSRRPLHRGTYAPLPPQLVQGLSSWGESSMQPCINYHGLNQAKVLLPPASGPRNNCVKFLTSHDPKSTYNIVPTCKGLS